ncbi:hypothetical protein PVAP13_5NG564400 [Panicum virgatum]|uniref:Uncharacterized protein n=1 Tax=Panicum virgatum TaxID=38727 RepID=A0A8T0S0Y2_PANVG|nr:hypothetical protein PVAP13_5NG564400 [Panicum virgatum]
MKIFYMHQRQVAMWSSTVALLQAIFLLSSWLYRIRPYCSAIEVLFMALYVSVQADLLHDTD